MKERSFKYRHNDADIEFQPKGICNVWATVATVAVGVVGAAVANNNAKKADARAAAGQAQTAQQVADTQVRVDAALEKLNALTPPNLVSLIQPYQKAVAQGEITPEEAVFKMQQETELKGIKVPPEILSAQQNALTKISQIANEGGMTAIDRAQLMDIQDQQSNRERGEREALVQEAQRRGIAGSGIELVGQQLAQQGAATRSAAAGVNVAANAQARALEALKTQGTLAGAQRTQDVNEQQAVANAQDVINKYNNSFSNSTDAANVAARNAAQTANLAEKQRISEYNIAQAQKEASDRIAASQTQWQNQSNLATNSANITAGLAGQANNASIAANKLAETQNQAADAQRAAAIQAGAKGASSLIDAYGKYQDKNKTTTTNPASAYDYKNGSDIESDNYPG